MVIGYGKERVEMERSVSLCSASAYHFISDISTVRQSDFDRVELHMLLLKNPQLLPNPYET